ncbi:hypothetical protein [Metapseudomonas resinovorans]|uniref:Uncharacterized protein n=1 Tax=Metapseudomonas resinovorans NBRC 106553 TaxID=1245471 RepID=S6ASN7_METRE|nr:hypothetical protein [Pseudomonas resinovorans]BAN49063.1 hypothetical protein PCA10_33310 [Pseudomonas resinovorans NBRC 106553]
MSPLVITLLIVVGIVILIVIGYVNHMVENSKLEKARLKADLSDRLRRCADLSETLPGQMVSPGLKLLLARLQLQFGERLLQVDKHDAALKTRLEQLRSLVAQGESIPVANPPQKILSEAKAKEIRFQLESLHGQVTRAAQDGQLPANEAKSWVKEIRDMLVQLHVEFFTNLGLQALQENQPRQSRLAFERGVQYLQKQPDPARYQAHLQQLKAQLARANALVLENGQPSIDEPSELTEGLKSLDDEDLWKKKNIYD